ncbi:hypothetical protein [Enterococcus timonensis]|uniref:hypothetical protein n=1 Tax=Enterococcus timonensis TaxID=1852364 RepID=UPI0008D90DE6|nr:hypothetical protein [Enterococcus timonensis]
MEQLPEQPIIYQQLHNSLKHGRLFHAYLFEGEDSSELSKVALFLMQAFFCQNPQDFDPCGQCNNCTRIAQKEHPDVVWVEPTGATIKIDQIRQLQTEFGKSGMETNRRGFMIIDCEKMSVSAANSLLKFLEDPQNETLAILTTTAIGKVIPTILSRVQLMHVLPLSKSLLEKQLAKTIPAENIPRLLFLTDSKEEAETMEADPWFQEASKLAESFGEQFTATSWDSFISVQTKLVPYFKEKKQQEFFFSLLLFEIHRQMLPALKKARSSEIILQAKHKWQSNVSFQNVLEQSVLIMKKEG